jgi:hypothetical protein
MIYTINKQEGTFYVDYIIQDNKCFIIEEFETRVKQTFICNTTKDKCDNLTETDKTITIEI